MKVTVFIVGVALRVFEFEACGSGIWLRLNDV